jgi:hypothetical protein
MCLCQVDRADYDVKLGTFRIEGDVKTMTFVQPMEGGAR